MIAKVWGKELESRALNRINIIVVWIVGLVAMCLAYNPPQLITGYYTDAIGALSAGLFVPVIAGLWWKKANLAGGIAAFLLGVTAYVALMQVGGLPKLSPILFALPISAIAMYVGSYLGKPDEDSVIESIAGLHGS